MARNTRKNIKTGEVHPHGKPREGTMEYYFHNYEHDGCNHCEGGGSNPYQIKHSGKSHLINKRYARGHGRGYKPQWFRFTSGSGGWYKLSSGVEVSISDVPNSFKH